MVPLRDSTCYPPWQKIDTFDKQPFRELVMVRIFLFWDWGSKGVHKTHLQPYFDFFAFSQLKNFRTSQDFIFFQGW